MPKKTPGSGAEPRPKIVSQNFDSDLTKTVLAETSKEAQGYCIKENGNGHEIWINLRACSILFTL